MDELSEQPWNSTMHSKARGSPANVDSDASTQDGLNDRHVFKRTRAHSSTARKSLFSRLDAWLAGAFPVILHPWLLSIPSLPTLLSGYLLFCVLILSDYVLSGYEAPSSRSHHTSQHEPSTLDTLALDHILSKVSSLRPLSLDLDVLSTPFDGIPYSACLWTTSAEVDAMVAWATNWTGPINLLVTSTAAPASQEHIALKKRLIRIRNKHSFLEKTLLVHILHLDPKAEVHPNAFLNLARLLSPSPRVVLFPGNLSLIPPKSLYRTLVSQDSISSSAMSSPRRSRNRKPVVLTLREHTSFPFAASAPLVMARDDSVWCTERFFAGISRSADWEECLWQVWLAYFGDIEIRPVQDLASSTQDDGGAPSPQHPTAVAKLHRRLVSKFRSETCALAVRRFAALRDPNSSADTKRARWLKRVCRGWSSG